MVEAATGSVRVARAQIQSIGWHTALAVGSAMLLGLSFPNPGWGWLAHVALAPAALLAIRSSNTFRLIWVTYLVWLVWWLVRLHWLAAVTAGGYITLCAYLATYTPLALWLIRWLHRRHGGAIVLLLPIVWVSLELVRGWFVAGGFGWFTIGHSQAPYRSDQAPGHLVQVADLFGEYGVSFLVLMTNGLLVDLLTRKLVRARRGKPRLDRTVRAAILLWVLAIGSAWAYGSYRLRQTPPDSDRSIHVAVVQTNVAQDNKINPTPEQRANDWNHMLSLTQQAATEKPKPDLIVWPETMVPAALNWRARARFQAAAEALTEEDPETAARYRQYLSYHDQITDLARRCDVGLIVGAPTYGFLDPNQRHNSAYYYHPNGTQDSARYDKAHLVPFGEYIPWVSSWPWLKNQFVKYLTPYDYDYSLTPGREWTVFHWPPKKNVPRRFPSGATAHQERNDDIKVAEGAVRITPSICFEDAVGRVVRQMVYNHRHDKRTDLVVNLTNDGWYTGPNQRQQHLQIAVFRCIENRVPMARSVNTGISGLIDSVGRINAVVKVEGRAQQVAGYAVQDIRLDNRVTLYGRWGHAPAVILAAFTAALAVAGLARPDRGVLHPRRNKS